MTQENLTTTVISATEAWMTWWASQPTETGDRTNDGASPANFCGFPTYIIAVFIIVMLSLIGILFFRYVTVQWCLQKRKIREGRQDETSGIVSQNLPEAGYQASCAGISILSSQNVF
jgi:hypothetical protein